MMKIMNEKTKTSIRWSILLILLAVVLLVIYLNQTYRYKHVSVTYCNDLTFYFRIDRITEEVEKIDNTPGGAGRWRLVGHCPYYDQHCDTDALGRPIIGALRKVNICEKR